MIPPARKLKFVTVNNIASRTKVELSKNLNTVITLYGGGGFVIPMILTNI